MGYKEILSDLKDWECFKKKFESQPFRYVIEFLKIFSFYGLKFKFLWLKINLKSSILPGVIFNLNFRPHKSHKNDPQKVQHQFFSETW